MPNIEIHGFRFEKEKVYSIQEKIFGLFKDHPLVNEMVITNCFTVVKDKNSNDQPFFRVINDRMKPKIAEEIIEVLHENFPEMDIEQILNQRFVPKKGGD